MADFINFENCLHFQLCLYNFSKKKKKPSTSFFTSNRLIAVYVKRILLVEKVESKHFVIINWYQLTYKQFLLKFVGFVIKSVEITLPSIHDFTLTINKNL